MSIALHFRYASRQQQERDDVVTKRIVILVRVSTWTRHAAAALAVVMLAAAGCGGNGNADKAEPGAGLEGQRATVVSEFERAVEEARYLRDDIAAVRADMRAVREAANHEAQRASREAASLRAEITALRREMRELSDGTASEVERTAEEAKSLREEVAAIRAEMSAVREVAEQPESLSSEEIAGNLAGADEFSQPVVIDEEVPYMSRSARRRYRGPQTVIYAPPYAHRSVMTQPRKFRRDGRRQSRSEALVTNTKPAAPSKPNVSNTRPTAPRARPVAPVARSAPRTTRSIQQKPVHIPQPER